jgi:hypothetical protein
MVVEGRMDTKPLETQKRFSRFSLRALLLLFIPLSIVLSIYGYVERQRQRAINSWNEIASKGVDAHVSEVGMDLTMSFKNGNVNDDDLDGFIPAFNGYAPKGFGKIIRMELCGSNVSTSAIEQFRHAVPDCEIIR